MSEDLVDTSTFAAPPRLSPRQEHELFQAVARRVIAKVRREEAVSTSDCLGTLAEMAVFGAFVSLKRSRELRSCCGFVRPGLPLADALDNAAVRAACDDPRFPTITADELDQLEMDVWLLWGARRVACLDDDRAEAIEIGRHGVQVTRHCSRGLLLPSVAVDHGFDAHGLLQAVCVKAGLPPDAWRDADTELVLFEGRAIHGKLVQPESSRHTPCAVRHVGGNSVADLFGNGVASYNRPRGANGADPLRSAACAGAFYPGTADEIARAIDAMLSNVAAPPEPWAAALVPHAGWMYSGALAAETLARVRFPSRAIVLSPRHRAHGSAWAVMPHAGWQLPGGAVESDLVLAAQLAAGIDGLELDEAAHREEHAIEVQLPLITRFSPTTRVVGIAVGRRGGLDDLLAFGRQLAAVMAAQPERPLLIISSDLNHGADDATTRRLDELAIAAMGTLDPVKLHQTVEQHGISMCGVGPAVVVLEALRQLGLLNHSEVVGHCTSADAGGSPRNCVGYAGMLFG